MTKISKQILQNIDKEILMWEKKLEAHRQNHPILNKNDDCLPHFLSF